MAKSLFCCVVSAIAFGLAAFPQNQNLARAAKPSTAVAAPLTPEQIADGWISLFDGETLFGWHPTSDANWKVQDGAITVSQGEQGFLMTGVDFADYELHVEFKAPATTNSGVFLRTPLAPADPAKDCYEINLAPQDNPFPTGSVVGRKRFPEDGAPGAKWQSYQDEDPATPVINPWDGNWHAIDVTAKGGMLTISLLDLIWHNYADQNPLTRGRIGLQFREGEVAFRNIRLKPLGLQPMLNGKDLAGWNTDNAEVAKFDLVLSSDPRPSAGRAGEGGEAGTRSELHVTNGRGILETDASYGDFVMQLDAFVDGDRLNSGVFFRSIPRQYADGYESQIHNGFKDGDPTKPTDFGTGAIYRRVAARRIVAKDHEWFTKTVVATGPHIAVWVNGYQVTDWTDERAPDDNPRSGRRLAPGTISLQAHDPTTNIRFRNLRVAELPEGD
jgi:hypothetical protein